LSDPPAHDELLFIVVHQVYELWFKQLLFELETIRDLISKGETSAARHYLDRVRRIEEVLIEQVSVIESMSPQDFLEFRQHLAPASGFQSVQFREVEFLSGLKDPRYLERLAQTDEESGRLRRRLEEPTLWDAFCTLLDSRGLPMPADDPDRRRQSLVAMARDRDRYGEEFFVSEALLQHDEQFALWRHRHVLMVERQIGTKSGTGGSTGAPLPPRHPGEALLPRTLGPPQLPLARPLPLLCKQVPPRYFFSNRSALPYFSLHRTERAKLTGVDERQVVRAQTSPGRTSLAALVVVCLFGTFGGLWLSRNACEGTGNDWFWFPVRTGGETYWGCEVADD
jgi:tryptophan 2,3-dioxygenase